jgi:hypothetical protein
VHDRCCMPSLLLTKPLLRRRLRSRAMVLKRGSWLVPFDEALDLSLIVIVGSASRKAGATGLRMKRGGAETFQHRVARPHREEPRSLGLPISPIRISA